MRCRPTAPCRCSSWRATLHAASADGHRCIRLVATDVILPRTVRRLRRPRDDPRTRSARLAIIAGSMAPIPREVHARHRRPRPGRAPRRRSRRRAFLSHLLAPRLEIPRFELVQHRADPEAVEACAAGSSPPRTLRRCSSHVHRASRASCHRGRRRAVRREEHRDRHRQRQADLRPTCRGGSAARPSTVPSRRRAT